MVIDLQNFIFMTIAYFCFFFQNKIEVGDVIDEAFGISIKGWRRGRVTALLRQKRGLPVSLKVIKVCLQIIYNGFPI